MNLIIQSQQQATQELESILKQAGFLDGWQVRAKESDVKNAEAPLFYKQTSPSYAQKAVIQKRGVIEQANLYLVYNIAQASIKGASDKPHSAKQVIYFTLHYNNEYLFLKSSPSKDNEFSQYLSEMLDLLVVNKWVLDDLGETSVEASDGSNVWEYQRRFRVEKLFN